MTTPILDITELAEALCDPRQHREPIYGWDNNRNRKRLGDHITTQEALLVQLHRAVVPLLTQAIDDGTSIGAAQSRPPLQLEALDRHNAITIGAANWCTRQGIRPRLTAIANIRQLVGHAPRLDADHQHLLRADLRRWRNWAATMAGWQSIHRPRAACPVVDCGQRDSLRVNLTTETGLCVACGSTWDQTTIGLLAEHITTQRPTQPRTMIRSGIQGNGGWATRHACPPITG